MSLVNICLVGAGRVGHMQGTNIKEGTSLAQVVAVVDPQEDAAKELSAQLGAKRVFTDFAEALEWGKFEAIVITTPTLTHPKIVVEAARAKKHIFCEKPLSLSLKEASQMREEVEQAQVKFLMGFMRRFDPGFLKAQERIEKREIGQVVLIKSTSRGPHLPPGWACDPRSSGGMLAEVSSHDFDTLRWFAHSEFNSLWAIAGNYQCPDIEYQGFYDHAVVSCKFNNGVMGMIDMGCPVNYGYDARMEILGTEGVIFVGKVEAEDTLVLRKDGQVTTGAFSSWRTRFKTAYLEEMRHFIKCIDEDLPPRVTLEDGQRVIEAVLAANRSIETSQSVEIGG